MVNKRIKQLEEHIQSKEVELAILDKEILSSSNKLRKAEEKIEAVQKVYVGPLVEQIELINRKIGELSNSIENIDTNVRVQSQLSDITSEIHGQEDDIKDLTKRISQVQDDNIDTSDVIELISKSFAKTLEKFLFPKLTEAYINNSNYLPFVRNTRYDELGSGGALTLITIAYFTAILKISIQLKQTYHSGILMFDTISANIGEQAKQGEEEFKDSKIYVALVRHLVKFAEDNNNDVQIILVNNGYPDLMSKKYVIAEFDGEGTKDLPYGLIDDANPV